MGKTQTQFQFDDITYDETNDIISSLKNTNSKDIYGINTKIIKYIGDYLVVPLTDMFNMCLKSNTFPNILKISKVIPVHKKGSLNDPSNFRPISIIPLIGKIFEKALKSRINSYFENNNLFNKAQFGFRTNHSTTMAINKLTEIISDSYDKGEFAGALFCDLTKAFDCVSFDILKEKLHYYGFHNNSVQLISSYLSNRKQQVIVNDVHSNVEIIEHGVPQGSVLGPILFIIYVNDLTSCVPNTDIILFADDTTVVTRNKLLSFLDINMKDTQSKVTNWFAANKLSLNNNKTDAVIFALRETKDWNNSQSVRFLSVHLDPKLTWEAHVNHVAKSLSTNIFVIRNLVGIVAKPVLKTVYHALIQSKLNYAILAWGHAPSASRIFSLQRRAVRLIDGLGYREDCKKTFIELKILTFPCLFILECLMYVKNNSERYLMHNNVHNYETRNNSSIYLEYHRVYRSRTSISYFGPKFFNLLPSHIKNLQPKIFKNKTKEYLLNKCFYSLNEYCDNNFSDF